MSVRRAPIWSALVVSVCVPFGLARAAGVTMNWTDCSAPARLTPDPNGKTWFVSKTGTYPTICPTSSGYNFRNLESAGRCATGGETIYIRGNVPYSGPVNLSNLHPSRRVLIVPYPGETATLDGGGTIVEWGSILNLQGSSNFAVQDLVIQNTGKTGAGSFGIDARHSSNLNFYYNTITNISNNGLLVAGTNIKAIGNLIHHTASIRLENHAGYFNDGLTTDPQAKSSNVEFSFNHVYDNGGECVGVYGANGATIAHNKIHDCINVNLYVSSTKNAAIDGNWSYATSDAYNVDGHRAAGIQLAVEAADASKGYPLINVQLTNNLIERVGQGIRFWRRCDDPITPDTQYGCTAEPMPGSYNPEELEYVYIAFNDFKNTQALPIKIDKARVPAPNYGGDLNINRIYGNISVHYPGFLYIDNWTGWYEASAYDFWSDAVPSLQTPGLVDPNNNGYQDAYKLRSDSTLIDRMNRNGFWVPASDYFCRDRSHNLTYVTPGAYEP